jgi:predicted nucleic acid-binding protein
MRIVLDASLIVEFLLGTTAGETVRQVAVETEGDVHIPHLAEVETASVLRGHVLGGRLAYPRAAGAIEDLAQLDARRWPATSMLPRILELRDRLTAYDATYVALCEAIDATLLTSDARMARAIEQLGTCDAVLIPLEEY